MAIGPADHNIFAVVKSAARGLWVSIILALTEIDPLALTGQHHPCPKCGGKDRYRAFDDIAETGGAICNQCGSFADGIATIAWLRGLSQIESARAIASHLNLDVGSKPLWDATATKPDAVTADQELRDRVYRALLELCPLSDVDHANLQQRGLSGEAIGRLGYGTLNGRGEELARLLLQSLSLTVDELTSVPGFVRQGNSLTLTVWLGPGTLVPLRATDGRIQSLKTRRRNPEPGQSRYVSLSGGRKHGQNAGAHCHVPVGTLSVCVVLRVTEGEIKADITFELTTVPTVSVPGIGQWRSALPVIEQLGVRHVIIAYDAPEYTDRSKPTAKHAVAFARELLSLGIEVEIETWPAEAGKGIDDVIAGGNETSVMTLDGLLAMRPDLTEDHAPPKAITTASPVHGSTAELLPGMKVKAHDRNNFGTILEDNGESCLVYFVSPDGTPATVDLPKSQLSDANGRPLVPSDFKLKLLRSDEFDRADFRQNYLVKGVLVEGQPGVVGGPKKCLKTGIMLDLAASLGTGTPFLSHPAFLVPKRVNTAVLSGESGGYVLRETARRILSDRNRLLSTADVLWGLDLPQLGNPGHLEVVESAIRDEGIRVLMIDPAYLCLLSGTSGVNPGNVFEMGSLLKEVGDLGAQTGCTIVIAHHTRKTDRKDRHKPTDLEDLAMSGFAEWARQWLLLARRTEYDGDGRHDLWLNVGGSAGHSGCYALSVNEGDVDDEGNGRVWSVNVSKASEAIDRAKAAAETRKVEESETRRLGMLEQLNELIGQAEDGETKSRLRDQMKPKPSASEFDDLIDDLISRDAVERCDLVKNGRPEKGFRRRKTVNKDVGSDGQLRSAS